MPVAEGVTPGTTGHPSHARNIPKYEGGATPRMATTETTIVEAIELIALSDPISTVLFLFGGLLTGASVLVLGWLAAGAAVEFVTPG